MGVNWGGVLGGLGSLAGLFGSKGPDYSSVSPYMQGLNGIAGNENTLGLDELSQYGTDNAAYRGALNNYASYLNEDPYTDSRDASSINQATSGASDAYNRANAALTKNLASRGIDPGSSIGAGAEAGLAASQAQTFAGAQNDLAYHKIADHQNRLQGLLALMGGAANGDYSRSSGALNSASGNYDKLANLGYGMSTQAANHSERFGNGLSGALGQLGTGLGSFF